MDKIYIKTVKEGEGFHCQGAYVNNAVAVRVKKTHDITSKIADGSIVICEPEHQNKKKTTKGDK